MNLNAVFDTNTLISGILWRGIPFQSLKWAEEGSLRIYTAGIGSPRRHGGHRE